MPRPALRRASISLILGAITTTAIAWALALWPRAAEWQVFGMPAEPPGQEHLRRRLSIEDERSPGLRWVQFTVSAATPDCIFPAWDSLGGASPHPPNWRFTPDREPLLRAAAERFPSTLAEEVAFEPPPHTIPPWPRWFPGIPAESPDGLISFGARASGWPLVSLKSISRMDPGDPAPRWSWSLPLFTASSYTALGRRDPALGAAPLLPDPAGFSADTAIFAGAWALLLFAPGAVRRSFRRRRGLCIQCAYNLRGLPVKSVCPECGGGTCPATGTTATLL